MPRSDSIEDENLNSPFEGGVGGRPFGMTQDTSQLSGDDPIFSELQGLIPATRKFDRTLNFIANKRT